MKRYLNGVLLIASIILLVLAVVYLLGTDTGDDPEMVVYKPQVSTVIVQAGLNREFGVTGSIMADQSARLTAEFRADVTQILVAPDDWVEQGQVLITLQAENTSSTWTTATIALENAQRSLTAAIWATEQSVAAARIALETARLNRDNTLAQNAAGRVLAAEALQTALLGQDLSTAAAQTALDNAVRQTATTVQSALTASDELLGISAAYKNYNADFESHLGALDTTTKNTAEDALRVALRTFDSYTSSYEAALALLDAVEDSTQATLTMLKNSVSSTVFPTSTLTDYVSTVTGELAAVRGLISTLQSAQRALESAEQTTSGSSQAVLSAQATYAATIAQLDAADVSAERGVESAAAALANAEAAAKLSRTSAQSALDSAQGGYDQATINNDKLTLRAPFAGKIVDVPVRSGEEVLPSTLLVVLENPAVLKIIAYLSPAEAQKVQVGDLVRFGQKSTATISAISPSADPVSRKYKIEIRHENPYLFPGEFIQLIFSTENGVTSNKFFIPLTSVQVLAEEVSVWVVVEGAVQKRIIELGVIEGEFVEVLAGLTAGEELVVSGGRIITTEGTEVAVSNIDNSQ